MSACNCIGPQNGEPVCPCEMKNVKIIDGRYVRVEDLGAAPVRSGDNFWKKDEHYSWVNKPDAAKEY